MKPTRPHSQRIGGFALVDLAMAMILVGALVGGLFSFLSARTESERARRAEQQILAVRHALMGHAIARGHLPCPADSTIPSGQPGAGAAAAADARGRCPDGYTGDVPWATLGLVELDPWHHRLTYHVAKDLVVPPDRCATSGALEAPDTRACFDIREQSYGWTATGDAFVVREVQPAGAGGTRTEPIANGLGVIIVSHGPNGALAHGANGERNTTAPARDHERDNALPATTTFHVPPADRRGRECPPAERDGCALDDTMGWLSRGELLVTLVRAGHALH